MLNWDDLRVFITAARAKSFIAAGQRLRMNPTTVARRITRLESRLKATLLVRSRLGLHLTSAGARLVEAGIGVEAAMGLLNQDKASSSPAGTVRISAAEGFATQIVAPALPAFIENCPGLSIELVASAGFLSPAVREVDIAITLAPPSSKKLFIEKLAEFDLGLYASAGYLKRRGTPKTVKQLRQHNLIGFIDDLLYTPELRFLEAIDLNLQPGLTSSSIRCQLAAAAADGGIVALPHFLGKPNPDMVVPILPSVRLTRTFWMSIHRELSEAARLRAVRGWLIELATKNGFLSRSAA